LEEWRLKNEEKEELQRKPLKSKKEEQKLETEE